MTENSESSSTGKAHTGSRNPSLEGNSGQYVEGDYGDAGAVGDEPASTKKGEYAGGDYGDAGVAEDVPAEAEEGQYPEGDYGKAGGVGQERPGDDEGEYPEGDYGAAGATSGRGASDDLRDELTEGQVNAPRNDDGGRPAGG
jgi:hypothetical protein